MHTFFNFTYYIGRVKNRKFKHSAIAENVVNKKNTSTSRKSNITAKKSNVSRNALSMLKPKNNFKIQSQKMDKNKSLLTSILMGETPTKSNEAPHIEFSVITQEDDDSRRKSNSFDKYKISHTTSNVKKNIVIAHNTKFSNVKKMETNGFQQNVDQTKRTSKVKANTITSTNHSGLSFLDNVAVDINEMGRESQTTNILAEINGFGKNIRKKISAPLEIIASHDKQGRFADINVGKKTIHQFYFREIFLVDVLFKKILKRLYYTTKVVSIYKIGVYTA
jgi:hypothetical protein